MKITQIAIRRPVTVSMFVVAVILFGVVSLDRLALNLLPDISYPSLTIQTDYEDAAPEEVESLVTRPIEEAVGVVAGLTRLSSVSRSGQSEVVLEFTWDMNMDLASMDVREKLDLIDLPRDVDKPTLLRFDPSYDPIMRLQLYGELSLSRLRYLAEKEVKQGLQSTEGVAAVKVIGGREEQIRIELDEQQLAELGVPITEVTEVLRQENLNQASGSLYDLDSNYLVRMLNEFRSVEEIERIIIRDQQGRKIVLGEVARVWRGAKDRDVIARLNGEESVELAVYKEGDANTVTVSEAVHQKLKDLTSGKTFPKGVEYQVVFDQATFISQAVKNVLMAAVLGGLLATMILFVFLRDLRSTVIIGLSIPISIMAAFALMYQTGITLNIMSLGGVALGVGMLVDNSIVVLESVHRHKQRGGRLQEAVYRGTQEVGLAVSASTLTTVAVFVPLVFVEGIAGQLFKDQALTITYSLLASLLVAITFIPMVLGLRVNPRAFEKSPESLVNPVDESSGAPAPSTLQRGSRFVARTGQTVGRFLFEDLVQVVLGDLRRLFRATGRLVLVAINPLLDRFESRFEALKRVYPRALSWSLDNKVWVFTLAVALVGVAAAAYQQVGAELIPPLTQGEFSFEVRLPEGRPIEQTDRVIRDVEPRVQAIPEVATVFSSVGGSNKNQFAQGALEENIGQLYVVMKDRRDKQAERSTINRIRQELGRHPDLTYTFSRPTLFSFKTPIEVEIYAFDLEGQRKAADLVAARLARMEGLSDIQTTTELGYPEIQIRFQRQRLSRLGLDESQIANTLRNKIRGEVASRYREEDKQIDILVRAEESHRDTIADIKNLVINNVSSAGLAQQGTGFGNQNSQQNVGLNTARRGEVADQDGLRDSSDRTQQQSRGPRIPIRLDAVADVTIARGPAEIRRIRSQRAAVVSANLTGGDLNSVTQEIRAELQQLRGEMPANTVIALGGQNEEFESSYRSLLMAIGLAVFLVYLVMASQFESFVHPFVIMFSVPLGLVGVILALFLTMTNVSVMVLLGVIILAGIVVNNAIVLIDYTNRLRQQGLPRREALLQAGQVRLRPIVMTTLTTVLGLIPMSLGWGEGAEVRTPMAITVIGGLLFSTVLTLVFIPVVYELVDRKVFVAGDGAQ